MFSGIIYCLRCMISSDIPLNQGCLAPITVYCPPRTILSPSLKAATVGSNVETSQRIVDLIFKAFRTCAASQGTCNNLTFGYGGEIDAVTGKVSKGFGYYETIAGGSGAGPFWDGQDGVHTNITNTRITDPETLEKRYPVILREFGIRRGTGGGGRRRGGDGCVRDIELTRPMQVSILSERRVIPPYGMAGGEDGARGVNLWIRRDPEDDIVRTISLGGRATTMMQKGDRIVIMTPGGGGYGVDENKPKEFVPDGEFAFEHGNGEVNGKAHGINGINGSAFRANGSVSQRETMSVSN
jgi:5-oxoprolinase (ATP-hydrolysing)